MAIHEKIKACCPRCNSEVSFKIKMCYVDYNGFIPCVKCPKCGVVVPGYSFEKFLDDGLIRIGV